MGKKSKLTKIITMLFILLIYIMISNISYAINITSNEYGIKTIDNEKYIIGIHQNTRAEKIKKDIANLGKVNLYNKEGKEKTNVEIIKTGDEIEIENQRYKAIVCGDINGDGKVSITDLLKIRSNLIGMEKEIAADIDANYETNVTDLVKIKRLLIRKIVDEDVFLEKRSNENYEYLINNVTKNIIITKLLDNKTTGTLNIPEKIEDGIVKEIRSLGNNNQIDKIIIPKEINKINNSAFKQMNSLKKITVDNANPKYSSKDGILYNKDKTEIIAYPSKMTSNKIHFFKQNQSGTAILLQSNGKFAMIDAGWEKDVDDVIQYMKLIGVKKLEFVLMTHWHIDHYEGLDEILNSFKVEKLYIKTLKNTFESYEYVQNIYDGDIEFARKNGAEVIFVDKLPNITYLFSMGQMQIKLYNLRTFAKEKNTESIISYIKIGDTKTLLPADADILLDNLMEEISAEIGYNVDVYQAPHHSCGNSARVYSLKPKNIVITNSAKAENYREEMISIYPNAKRYFSNDVKNAVVVNYTPDGIKIESI